MTPYFKLQNLSWLLVLGLFTSSLAFGQKDVEKWKLQVALGVNNTLDQPETEGYYSQRVNFPTINLGLQHMFSRNFGAKLDLGYNRSTNNETSLPYKLNYTRVNVQAVYDFKDLLTFLPSPIGIVAHAGPGVSKTKPLGNFANNTYTYPNLIGGVEVHYRLSESLSIYVDGAYIKGLSNSNKYDFAIDGYSFNGDMMYLAVGFSISLSGCNYCY